TARMPSLPESTFCSGLEFELFSGNSPEIIPACISIVEELSSRAFWTLSPISLSFSSLSRSDSVTSLIYEFAFLTVSVISFLAATTAAYASLNNLTHASRPDLRALRSMILLFNAPCAAPAALPDHRPTPSKICDRSASALSSWIETVLATAANASLYARKMSSSVYTQAKGAVVPWGSSGFGMAIVITPLPRMPHREATQLLQKPALDRNQREYM